MIVRVELSDATLDFEVESVAEGKHIVNVLARNPLAREYARFDYAGGQKRACILRRDVRWAGMLTSDEAAQEDQQKAVQVDE